MPKRSSKDLNETAFSVMQQATGHERVRTTTAEVTVNLAKNPAAVALGRLGGLKGGKARAEQLSQERKRAIAVAAAQARWSKKG
jgi:uncharacterized protein YhbP (UPF0306 family)